jgi:hypothetical protein
MKRSVKPLIPQLNLPLIEAPATVPGNKQKELALTLMQILIDAARENEIVPRVQGGEDERAEAQR